MDGCVFCPMGSGDVDSDLVLPTSRHASSWYLHLRQRARNRGHALVLPVEHVRNLHDARADLRDEIFAVVAMLTGAIPAHYGAVGSYVFQNNVEPDGGPFHLACARRAALQRRPLQRTRPGRGRSTAGRAPGPGRRAP